MTNRKSQITNNKQSPNPKSQKSKQAQPILDLEIRILNLLRLRRIPRSSASGIGRGQTLFVILSLALGIWFLTTPIISAQSSEENLITEEQFSEVEADVELVDLGPSIQIESMGNVREVGDFVVGPGKVEAVLNPGESRTFGLRVTNRMGENRIFRIEIEDFTGSRSLEQTVVLLGDVRGPYSLKDYIRVPSLEFNLGHGERATIPVRISVPFDEEPGGRYGSVVISTVTRPADRGAGDIAGGAAIVSRIGTLFFIRVPGETEEGGLLRSFRTKAGKKIFAESPIGFEILYENTGSVHLNPYGEIRVSNMLGKEVGTVELEPWFTMPDSLRLREVSWSRDWLFGIYTAHAFINRGYEDIIDEASFTYFVLPWKPIVLALILLFVLVIILRFIFKRFEFRRKT